jgi:hypothetical protein
MTQRRIFLRGLAGVVVAGLAIGSAHAQTSAQTAPLDCPRERITIDGAFGTAVFNVDVVADDAGRARGLMHVPSMPLSTGMLFIYEQPQQLSFWMRNTLIELDMLFVDSDGMIRHIHDRAQPLDETPISPGNIPLLGVLEINGGLARRLGIEAGAVLRHPAFSGADVPWVCGAREDG